MAHVLDEIEGEETLLETDTGALKVIPIEEVVPADWNYKADDPEMEEKLENNLKRLGQVENTHVRQLDTGYYEMVNGNHRLNTLKALDETHVIAFDHGDVSQSEAIRRAIETNETNFEPDQLELGARIEEVAEDFSLDSLEETMPFGEDELEDLATLSDFDFDEFEDEYEPDGQNDGNFATYEVTVPDEVVPVLDDAARRVEQELQDDGHELHEEDELRRGQVLEVLAAEYMASPQSPLNS